jgi:creatinine amidohydrolase/Fe(II)-dependent formamide hydrolase-like protein
MIKPLFAEMKTTDFADCAEWIAVLPISAIEQHGPHLPLETDFAIANGNIAAIIPHIPHDLPLTFLPILPFGKSDEHGNFKGTLTLSANTMINIIVEIGESLAKSGIKKLIIANSHGGNVSVMDIASLELRKRFNMLIVQLVIQTGYFPPMSRNLVFMAARLKPRKCYIFVPVSLKWRKRKISPRAGKIWREKMRNCALVRPFPLLGWRKI